MSHHPLPRNPSLNSGSSSSSAAVTSNVSTAAMIPSETDEKCRKGIKLDNLIIWMKSNFLTNPFLVNYFKIL